MNCRDLHDSRYLAVIKSYSDLREGGSEVAWLVSLGDLLTLLLCFFLAVVSMSPLNPAVEREMKAAQNQSDMVSDAPLPAEGPVQMPDKAAMSAAGTPLAKSIHESELAGPAVNVEFTASDFPGREFTLMSDAVLKLKREIDANVYPVREVLIESCGGESTAGRQASGWNESVRRAFILRGQLIDSRIADSIIKVRLVGGNCKVLNSDGKGEVSARVKLVLGES
jgi:hypothetical protein